MSRPEPLLTGSVLSAMCMIQLYTRWLKRGFFSPSVTHRENRSLTHMTYQQTRNLSVTCCCYLLSIVYCCSRAPCDRSWQAGNNTD